MAVKNLVKDWRGRPKWTPMQRRRKADLVSCLSTWTERPIPGVRTLAAWSYGLLTQFSPGVWSYGGDTAIHRFSAEALFESNNWHLINGVPRMVFDGGTYQTYACDMRNIACATALADHITTTNPGDASETPTWIDGVHMDYFNVPTYLPAFAEFANDATFAAQWTAGMAAFVNRVRANKPNFIIVGQDDQRVDPTMEDGINGYWLEQYIGKFSSQTSLGTVQGWMDAHKAQMAAAHAGREWVWVVEDRFPRLTWDPAPFGLTADGFFQAHVNLCNTEGAYLATEEEDMNGYTGHNATAGKSTRTVELKPVAVEGAASVAQDFLTTIDASQQFNFNQWYPDHGSGSGANLPILKDNLDGTFAYTDEHYVYDLFAFEPVPAEAEAVLDVQFKMRAASSSAFGANFRAIFSTASGAQTGMLHTAGAVVADFLEPPMVNPDFTDWTIDGVNGIVGGYQSWVVGPSNNVRMMELRKVVTYEYTSGDPDPPPTDIVTGHLSLLQLTQAVSLFLKGTQGALLKLTQAVQSYLKAK